MINKMLSRKFFTKDPLVCAEELIGAELQWGSFLSRIVETEAYLEKGDAACHAFYRKSTRTFLADNPPGTAYVYLNYGIHWMFNVLVKGPRNGLILFRAVEPLSGIQEMERRRKRSVLQELCSGPGKLAQAMGITGKEHEKDLCADPMFCFLQRRSRPKVVTDVRIGISQAKDLPWRFLLKDSPYVSRKVQKRPD